MLSASQQVAQQAAAQAIQNVQAGQNMVDRAADAITAQQTFIIESFRGQIYISDELDVQDTPLYDTDTFAASGTMTTANSQLFSNVETGSGKTTAQTNMNQNRKLDAPEAFAVFGLRLGWSEDVFRSDVQTFLNSWAYEFWLGQKAYQRANIRHFSSGWGLAGYTTKTSESFYTNGQPGRGSMNMVMVKLVIANQMSFYAQFTGSTQQVFAAAASGGVGMIILNELVGLYARGVQ